MAEKKGFVIYFDWREQFELLPPEDRGKLLMALLDYEREQLQLKEKREMMAAEIARNDEVYENIEKFLPIIRKYTDIQELTAQILNELIEKIVVHEKVIAEDGTKSQQVDIYYKFIGCINQRRNSLEYTALKDNLIQEFLEEREHSA